MINNTQQLATAIYNGYIAPLNGRINCIEPIQAMINAFVLKSIERSKTIEKINETPNKPEVGPLDRTIQSVTIGGIISEFKRVNVRSRIM